ncbi:MAG: tetratricopeptide repeat protein [Myxococcota bacterium]
MDRLERLSQVAASNPNDAGIWLELADALLDLGAVDPAQHMVARARACEPSTAQQWSSMGELLLRLGDPAAALDALRAATILNGEDAHAAALYAETAIDHGAAEEAEELLERATCFKDPAERLYLIARAKEAQNQIAAALETVLEAIRDGTTPMKAHAVLAARLARRVERFDIYERALRRLCVLDPTSVDHAVELVDCLIRRSQDTSAMQVLSRAAALPQRSARDLEALGARFAKLGDGERAQAHLEAAVNADPGSMSARILLAQTYEASGRLEHAISLYRSVATAAPSTPGVSLRLGTALMKIERYAEAAAALVKAVAAAPDDADIRSLLTQALMMSGDAEAPWTKEGGLSGDLSVFKVEELIEFLGIQRATGQLLLTSNGRQGVIRIEDGMLTQTRYSGQTSLVSLLIEKGFMTTERARALPQEVTTDDLRLAEVLLKSGEITTPQLEAILQARVEQGIMQMLGWAAGRAQFEPQPPQAGPAFGFKHQRILMSVMAQLDEARR